MLVISYALQQTFSIELVLGNQVINDLLIKQVRPLGDLEFFTILCYYALLLGLDVRRANMERKSLRLVRLIPRMLPDFVHIYSFRWISNENTGDHILSLLREELW